MTGAELRVSAGIAWLVLAAVLFATWGYWAAVLVLGIASCTYGLAVAGDKARQTERDAELQEAVKRRDIEKGGGV